MYSTPDGVKCIAYVQTLGLPSGNYHDRSDYIIIANFEVFWHDIREWFDQTGGEA